MTRKDTVVGLDIGRYAVKAVWATRRGAETVITRAEVLRLPLDGSGGPAVIAPWAQKMELARHPCVLGLPGQHVVFQPFTLPPGDPRTLEQAADMEVLRFNELASETMVCGFSPFSLKPDERRVLLAMARQSVVDEVLEQASEARLNVVDLVPAHVGLVTSQAGRQLPPAMTLYVDMGHATTSLAVAGPAGLLFARSFGGGGQLFTGALARARSLTGTQAEHLKLTQVAFTDDAGTPVTELAQPASVWLTELQSCLSLYNLLYPEAACRISRVALCGGGARLRGFAAWAGARLDLPVSAVRPLPGLPADASPQEFAVAAGLAFGALGPAPAPISLLPPMMKDELMFRRQKPVWIAAGIAAALILAVSLFGGSRDIRRKSAQLREQRASLARRQQLVAQIEAIQTQNEDVRAMAAPLRGVLGAPPVMRNLLTLLSQAKAPSESIEMICDAETYFAGRPGYVGARAPGGRSARRAPDEEAEAQAEEWTRMDRVVIEGYTRRSSLSTVRELISRIREARYVKSADLLSDDQLAPPDEDQPRRGLPFVIDVRLAEP